MVGADVPADREHRFVQSFVTVATRPFRRVARVQHIKGNATGVPPAAAGKGPAASQDHESATAFGIHGVCPPGIPFGRTTRFARRSRASVFPTFLDQFCRQVVERTLHTCVTGILRNMEIDLRSRAEERGGRSETASQ